MVVTVSLTWSIVFPGVNLAKSLKLWLIDAHLDSLWILWVGQIVTAKHKPSLVEPPFSPLITQPQPPFEIGK